MSDTAPPLPPAEPHLFISGASAGAGAAEGDDGAAGGGGDGGGGGASASSLGGSGEPARKNPVLGLASMLASAAAHRKLGAPQTATGPDFRKPGAHDNHPFFSYYGLLVHQQNMMQDAVRTAAYQTAIVSNAADFADKVVMDIGTGSGILAHFAVQAGARCVYAVEASNVADRATTLLAHNGLSSRIHVLKARVEEVVLPDDVKVDVMVSEPMGFMLIHERMLESYMIARQLFLKPGGRMFPSSGTIYAAPFTDATLWQEQVNKIAFWHNKDFYGLDLSCLAAAAAADHFAQPVVGYVDAASLISDCTAARRIDFEHDLPESLHDMTMAFDFVASRTAVCHGLALWFDVSFDGTTHQSVLSTAPTAPGTHWYQCRLLLRDPIALNARQRISGSLHMRANARYSYDMTLSMELAGSESSTVDGRPVESLVHISLQDQMYHYGTPAPAAASAPAPA